MKNLKDVFEQVHERSLWQVLGIYLAGSWAGLEVISTFVEQGLFPPWAFRLGLVLLLIGLPIVLVTAYVQKGLYTRPQAERSGLGRVFTWRNAVLGGVGAFALWGVFAAAWLLAGGRPAQDAEAVVGLTGIAVLPFEPDGSGDGLDALSEGIPTLLASNLDGVGGFRKIDPRSLHTVWRREMGMESVDVKAMIDFARRRGAAYAITGDLIGTADRVVLSVDVYDVEAGRPSGPPIRVDGPADSLLSLVDRLSVEILRAGLIPADADIPSFDLARATTPSLEALRAFVDGEREYRRSMYRPAIEHFNEAVAIDSTFPLALYRLATSHLLENRVDLGREYASRALRHAERLPPRERQLLEAYHAYANFEDRSIDMLRDYTRRYPDDSEGWFLLGEAYYHIGTARLEPFERFEAATLEAIEKNPYYGPPYIHLIDEAFRRADSATALELIDQYGRIDRDTDWCVGYELAAGVAWGGAETRDRTMALLDTVPGDPLYCAQRALNMTPALWEPYEVVWDEQLTRDTFDPPFRGDARWPRAWALAQRGRVEEASTWFTEVGGREPSLTQTRIETRWIIAGYRDDRLRAWVDLLDRGPQTGPADRWPLAVIAADEGRLDDAADHVTALRALADSLRAVSDTATVDLRTGDKLARLADATEAAIGLRRAPDDPVALERAIEALSAVSAGEVWLTVHMRYDIGRALAAAGRFEEALPYFESFRWLARPYKAPTEYWLGRIHEGLGNVEEARSHYGNFVTWWADADPQFHEWREEARERLARLIEVTEGGAGPEGS